MEQQQKENLIYAILYLNRDKDILEHEIRVGQEDKLSNHDIDVILEGLCERGIVSFVQANDKDGGSIPFLRYRLSSYGLSLFDKMKDVKAKFVKPVSAKPESGLKSNEELPENPFPIIFKNSYAYLLFLDLMESTVKEKTKVADYAFIFHKMKNKTFYAINSVVTQPIFIKFLNENFRSRISVKILPIKTPAGKEELFTTLFNKYKDGILK